jgi:PPOX class probable F420-dependent enzyme
MQSATSLSALGRARYVSLTTYRRTGEPVSTPVWIAPDAGDRGILYALTMVGAGKLKRIRNNPSVTLAPCDFRGRVSAPPVAAVARILNVSEHGIADRALTKKYGLQKRALDLYHYLGKGRRAYLAIESAATSALPGELAG